MGEFYNMSRFNVIAGAGDSSPAITPALFDGRSIRDAVPYANVLDIRIGAPSIETTTIVPGINPGLIFSRNRHGSRNIEIDVEVPLIREAYPEYVRMLRSWAMSSEPKRLVLSSYPGRYIMAICTNLSDFSQAEWWMPITIQMECCTPYFVSVQPSSSQIGAEFVIEGDVFPEAVITYELGDSGVLAAPQWTFDGNNYIKLNSTICGGSIEIDLIRKSVYNDDTSLMANVTLGSRFPALLPGRHVITGPAGGTITWYERWL